MARILDPTRLTALTNLCQVASQLAESKGYIGKVEFFSSIQSFAKLATATDAQETRVISELEWLRSAPHRELSREGKQRGAASAHARHAPARLPTLSFLKDKSK